MGEPDPVAGVEGGPPSHSLLDDVSDLVFVFDQAGRIVYQSAAVERVLGYPPAEGLGRNALQVLHPEDRPMAEQALARLLAAPGSTTDFEGRALHRSGATRQLEGKARSRRDAEGCVSVLVTVRDVTDRKSLEAQLLQAQKIEAVGRLAGGVAHDFNNIVTAILGHGDLLLRKLDAASPQRRHVEQIVEAGERAAALTQQLLAFSRRQLMQPRVLAMGEVVARARELLTRVIGEDIELVTRVSPDVGHVRADPVQIEQVILNLAINARDAMTQGGRLLIEASNMVLDEVYARGHVSLTAGSYVLLAVSDTGHGMDAATQARIFEPFFTTKELGKGTGLGLSTVYGIVKQSGGYIWVYSEVGQGTTFKVYLPRVDQPAEELPRHHEEKVPATGSETILLVEDEDGVRDLVRELLQTAGYTVLDAGRPIEALRKAAAHEGPLHLLITDVVLPEISGQDLARRVRKTRPEIRMLFLSGYTAGMVSDMRGIPEGALFLQKPFTAADLESSVRQALTQTPEGARS